MFCDILDKVRIKLPHMMYIVHIVLLTSLYMTNTLLITNVIITVGVTVDDDEDKVKEEMTAILEDRVKC